MTQVQYRSPDGVPAQMQGGTPLALPEEQIADALATIEFEAVLELIAAHAVGPLGRARVLGRRPTGDLDWVRAELDLVGEVAGTIRSGRCAPISRSHPRRSSCLPRKASAAARRSTRSSRPAASSPAAASPAACSRELTWWRCFRSCKRLKSCTPTCRGLPTWRHSPGPSSVRCRRRLWSAGWSNQSIPTETCSTRPAPAWLPPGVRYSRPGSVC